MKKPLFSKEFKLAIKATVSLLIAGMGIMIALAALVIAFISADLSSIILCAISGLILPSLLPFLWLKKRKPYFICWLSVLLALFITCSVAFAIEKYNESITIDVTPNINVREYLPFTEDSKIVKIDSKTLKLTDNLPIIDGATAAFPVYSAFVHAVYPSTTTLYDMAFRYNNTLYGYQALARKETHIFIGAYPSKEQIEYAAECGTTFEYTQIGSEAFVFFVHKDNPVNSLTTEQIKGIYSGQITNWKEVGGNDEKIEAFQRNKGSGSQSMMLRFMGDTPMIEPDTTVISGMGEIIEKVADYKSKSGSMGFSFRYYVEGIIQNPDIKLIAVDGVAPTVENIKTNAYPIVAPVYAVTYEGNPNPNVKLLIDWMLSEEGQYIIEETGYVGIDN